MLFPWDRRIIGIKIDSQPTQAHSKVPPTLQQPIQNQSLNHKTSRTPRLRTVKPMDILTRFGPHKELLASAVLADVLDALGQPAISLPGTIRPLCPTWKLFGRAATLSAVSMSAQPERPYEVEL